MSPLNKILGQTIKKHRKLKGYSTQSLSQKLGISVGLINNIEHGKYDTFKIDILMSLVSELDIPIGELFCINKKHLDIKIDDNNLKTLDIDLSMLTEEDLKLFIQAIEPVNKAYLNLLLNFENKQQATKVINLFILNSFKTLSDVLEIK